ncbi:ABC transporter permease [Lacibacterium aquatile]|uniref:ABC transporter permease n=1 Tax=Lacibacterium aquatile TaxID=1168082 RepID=A0ABW5DWP6_9PROT
MSRVPLSRASTLGLGAGGLLVFVLLWEALAQSGLLPTFVAPAPSSLPAAFWKEVTGGFWLKAIKGSAGHYFLGLLAGCGLGISFGIAAGLSYRYEAAQQWIVRVIRPIPGIAWIPFAIIWFGISEGAAVFIIGVGVFWITYFSAFAAVRSVDPDLLEVAEAFGHRSSFAKVTKIVLPAAAPGILGGVRIALGQGWMAVVAAELFGIPGMGSRMQDASGLLQTQVVIVYMLTIAALYSLTDIVFGLFSKVILQWQR